MNDIDWKWALTNFDGRLNRQPYWIATVAAVVATFIVMTLTFGVLPLVVPYIVTIPIILAAIGIVFFVGVAVAAKRLHDRDKSAHWLWLFYGLPLLLDIVTRLMESSGSLLPVLTGFISLAISVWALVELGFLRGTLGPNRYGPDPLDGGGAPAPAASPLGDL